MVTALHVTSCQDEFRQQQIAMLWRASGAKHTQVAAHTHTHTLQWWRVPIFTCSAFCFCRGILFVGLWRLLVHTWLLHSTCSKTHQFLCLCCLFFFFFLSFVLSHPFCDILMSFLLLLHTPCPDPHQMCLFSPITLLPSSSLHRNVADVMNKTLLMFFFVCV